MTDNQPTVPRVLFVCLGNICRSPLAEAILRRQANERHFEVKVDSAGTGNYHIGQLPDARAIATGQARGCSMGHLARQVVPEDFTRFDIIVPMDGNNLANLEAMPHAQQHKLHLMLSFDPDSRALDVPDPYYGTQADFEKVADMLEPACAGLLDWLEAERAKAS